MLSVYSQGRILALPLPLLLSYDTINGETITPLALGVSEPYYLLQPQEWPLGVQITE